MTFEQFKVPVWNIPDTENVEECAEEHSEE